MYCMVCGPWKVIFAFVPPPPFLVMYHGRSHVPTAGESVFYRRSDGSLVPAIVLGPGAQSETMQIEYKHNEHLVKHPAALIANLIPDSPDWDSAASCQCGKGEGAHTRRNALENLYIFFRGMGMLTVMRNNQPLVPRSNFGGKACAGTNLWFRGRTLPVPGHKGGGGTAICLRHVLHYASAPICANATTMNDCLMGVAHRPHYCMKGRHML